LAGAELCTITNSKKAGYVTSKHANGEHVHLGIARYICLFLGAKVEYLRKFINLTTLVIAVPVPISYIAIKQKVTHNLLILVCTKRE